MVSILLRKTGFALLSGGLMLLGVASCTNSDEIGLNLTPPGERFKYVVDSTTVITAATLRQDSLTSEKREICLLGSMNDPVMGQTTASLMTQLRLSSNDVDFGVNAVIDSAMLLMKYAGYSGDTSGIQKVRIYELTKDLYYDSTYFSNQKVEGWYNPDAPIADFSYRPTPEKDSVMIRLSDDFGNKLIHADTAYLSNNPAWLAWFKGLYLQAENVDQGGSVVYYDFKNGKSRLVLYYHNDAADSLQYEVVINSNCSWVNLFNHNYSTASMQGQINDSVFNHSSTFLQSMAGLRAKLKLDLPQALLDEVKTGVTINKAELIITVPDDPTAVKFPRPTSLRIYNVGEGDKNEFIDDLLLGESYYGGTFNALTSTYRFNIGLHLQNLLHPDSTMRVKNNGLFLVLTNERTSGNRLVLKNSGMRLVVTYTPLQ
jgi:hypothetical protein